MDQDLRISAARNGKGFSLLEVVLALSILSIGSLAFYTMLSRGLLLSETNKQVKIALFHGQTVVEEIMGTPFDQIMDPDYPVATAPEARFRHMQEIRPLIAIFGFMTDAGGNAIVDSSTLELVPRGLPADGHKITQQVYIAGVLTPVQRFVVDSPTIGTLSDECITVTYGSQLDTADADGDGDTTNALALPIITNSQDQAQYVPTAGGTNERFRPQNNQGTSFVTPEPLYFTVEVSWKGPKDERMSQRLTAVRSR